MRTTTPNRPRFAGPQTIILAVVASSLLVAGVAQADYPPPKAQGEKEILPLTCAGVLGGDNHASYGPKGPFVITALVPLVRGVRQDNNGLVMLVPNDKIGAGFVFRAESIQKPPRPFLIPGGWALRGFNSYWIWQGYNPNAPNDPDRCPRVNASDSDARATE